MSPENPSEWRGTLPPIWGVKLVCHSPMGDLSGTREPQQVLVKRAVQTRGGDLGHIAHGVTGLARVPGVGNTVSPMVVAGEKEDEHGHKVAVVIQQTMH
jgi:hypothetical protein